MFKEVVYILIFIVMLAGIYVGHSALKRQAYTVYAPLFVETYAGINKSDKDLQAYPNLKKLNDEIFIKKQRELNLKIVLALVEINQKLNLGGDFKKALDKYKVAANPDADFLLVREFQESSRLLPPISWKAPKFLYYIAANSLCVSYDQLTTLISLKNSFVQKLGPYEAVLAPR